MSALTNHAANAETQQKDARANQTASYVESLKKCSGWNQWMKPKVFTAFEKAEKNIMNAAALGHAGSPADILVYQAFHELVSTIRLETSLAEKRIGKNITFE